MANRSGIALKFLQWFIRAIQFCCCAVVLALYSYFLATLNNHGMTISTDIRAVEGISGVGVVYTAFGLLLLCCLAGHPAMSTVAMILDVAFAGAFIYVASANRNGASSCTGNNLVTPYGTGSAQDKATGTTDGFTNIPTYRQACQMQSAALAVSIVAIFFFLFSVVVEFLLVRNRRKVAHIGPSPDNNYTAGPGQQGGFFGRMFSRRRRAATFGSGNPNALPEHTHPDQVRTSYATETTAVGHEPVTYNKYSPNGNGLAHDGQTAYPEQTTGVSGPNPYRGTYTDI